MAGAPSLDETHTENDCRHTDDDEPMRGGRQGGRTWIANERHRSYSREDCSDDRERKKTSCQRRAGPIISRCRDDERKRREDPTEQERRKRELRQPCKSAGELQRQHSGVVRRSRAAADDRPTQCRGPTPKIKECHHQADAGNECADEQGQEGQTEIVAGSDSRIMREDRDEMCRPHTKAQGGGIQAQPNNSQAAPGCGLGAVKEIYGNNASEKAEGAGQRHKTPIALNQICDNLKHGAP